MTHDKEGGSIDFPETIRNQQQIDFTNEESSPEISNTDQITQTLSPSPGKMGDDDGFVSSSI
jgi:hypothetical protein